MNFRQKITLYLLLSIVLGSVAFAQVVDIPDPNLHAGIADALGIPRGTPITQEDMNRLTHLDVRDQGIANLTGLQSATNLTFLQLQVNRIEDISPLGNLTQLTELHLGSNRIEDISPLANLVQLTVLRLNENWQIEDISPLANLTQLRKSDLDRNEIVDVSPLARLTRLESLDLRDNRIIDVSPLANLTQLTELRLDGNQIIDVTPLANLTNLVALWFSDNGITDVTAHADLTQLTELRLGGNQIEDIHPLERLTELVSLDLRDNWIIDVSSLANLTQLTELDLSENRIVDVSPLAGLAQLEVLDIRYNFVTDYHLLDGLALNEFLYDQICELPPFPVRDRIENKRYPSIWASWGAPGWIRTLNRPDLSDIENLASHDLWLGTPQFGLRYQFAPGGINLVNDVDAAIQRREEYLAINPNMVFLVQVSMRSGEVGVYLPQDSPYWIRDAQGNIVQESLLDFTDPYIQDRIVQQAIAVSKCGLYDGIFFDWWNEHGAVLADRFGDWNHKFRGNEAEQQARDNILRRIRVATRPDFLIMGNTNYRIIPRTGPYINGGSMETGFPGTLTDIDGRLEERLTVVENALFWLEQNIREPRTNALATAAVPTEPPDSTTNLRWMRVATTLSLTHSDGYVLFTRAPGSNYHYWYDFWDADLGRPVSEKGQLYQETEGLYIREFTNGWAVYNHSGEAQVITLPEEVQGVASGLVNVEHALPNLDGEMYLKAVVSDQSPVTSKNPADVNGDGVVNILDLVLVAQGISGGDGEGDVNGDGVVNVFDLVQVAAAIGGGGAAPSTYSPELSIISAADVAKWLALAQRLGVGDATFQQGIRFLEGLLAALTPKETALLPNYPNPFNPETWIPYRLAREAEVAITIYDTKGTLVRRLALGNQAAGYYAERGKAAYWDGRNERGEAVASGIYVYQFRAGDYAASRRLVIVK